MKLTAVASVVALCVAIMPPAGAGSTACDVKPYTPVGTHVTARHLGGPGLVLAGSGGLTMPRTVLKWMHTHLTGSTARAGNVLVLTASGDNAYDKLFYAGGNFASVRTVRIPPCSSRHAVDRVAQIVDASDAVFFSGGDQSHYVAWKGTRLMAAVKRLYARGGIVGGGSAGLAIQGAVVYDAVSADRFGNDTHTADAVKYPNERRISFTTGLFSWPALSSTITDTHFVARNRFGRLVVFLARISSDGVLPRDGALYGLGVDQESAVVVDRDGSGIVLNTAKGRGAYLVRFASDRRGPLSAPLRLTVLVSHIGRNGEHFDLLHKRAAERWYPVTVDGGAANPYNRNPY